MAGSGRRTAALAAGWLLLAVSFLPLVMTLVGLSVAPREAVSGADCVGDPGCDDEDAAFLLTGAGVVLLVPTLAGGVALVRRAHRRAVGAVLTAFGGLAAFVTFQSLTDPVGDDTLRVISITGLSLLTLLLLTAGVVMQVRGRRAPAPTA
jgi:hypothetical protein